MFFSWFQDVRNWCSKRVPNWVVIAPFMQTELARLSIFMSLAGYVIVFSDLLFPNGLPSFNGLVGAASGNTVADDRFFLSSLLKWQLFYFALIFLMCARLLFISRCPKRLKEHGFLKSAYIQSMQTPLIENDLEAVLSRISPKSGNTYDNSVFDQKKHDLTLLLFPEYNLWAKINYQLNAEQSGIGNAPSDVDASDAQPSALHGFLVESLEDDFDLALRENVISRLSVTILGLLGYLLVAIPSVDLMRAVFLATVYSAH